ncbi:unnamed protein product [Closterium sp. NIES-53]
MFSCPYALVPPCSHAPMLSCPHAPMPPCSHSSVRTSSPTLTTHPVPHHPTSLHSVPPCSHAPMLPCSHALMPPCSHVPMLPCPHALMSPCSHAPMLLPPFSYPCAVSPHPLYPPGYFNQDELISLASIARDCVHQAPSQRPSMLDVLTALEDTVDEDLLSSLHGPSTRLLSPGSTASGITSGITSTSNGDRYTALANDGAFDDAAGGGTGMGGGGAGKRSAGSSFIDVISASFRRRGGGDKGGGKGEGMQRGSGQGPPSPNRSGRSDVSDIESSSLLYITPKGH